MIHPAKGMRVWAPGRISAAALLLLTLAAANRASGQPCPIRLEVSGPQWVAENFHAEYAATAYFDNNTTRDVTAEAVWLINPSLVGVFSEPGRLATLAVSECRLPATVTAIFTACGVQQTGTRSITILATRRAGSALRFDGADDFAQIPSPSFDLRTQVTVEFWLWVDVLPPGPLGDWILVNGEPGQASFGVGMDVSHHVAVHFRFEDPATTSFVILGYPETASAGEWIHLAAVLDTQVPVARLYANGRVVAETSTLGNGAPIPPGNVQVPSGPLYIGGSALLPGTFFEGRIDELRIWNVAREPGDIQTTLFRRLSGTEPGLVGYWRFDEAEGQVVSDHSPLGNHGFLGTSQGPDPADPLWVSSDAPVGPPPLPGDLNDDSEVDLADLGILLADIGCEP